MLADDVEPGESVAELHQRVVHRLGNLTLTAYNPDLGNQPFAEKREVLANSHLSLSREIAEYDSWGAQQIEDRGRAIAERAIGLWPGPLCTQPSAPDDQWRVVRQICAALAEGSWTAYGDIAAVTGMNPQPLGNHLASTPVPNGWRVLRVDGSISPGFRWLDPEVHDDPREVLAAEGVRFNANGQADATQHLSPTELAALLGLEIPDGQRPPTMSTPRRRSGSGFSLRRTRPRKLSRRCVTCSRTGDPAAAPCGGATATRSAPSPPCTVPTGSNTTGPGRSSP